MLVHAYSNFCFLSAHSSLAQALSLGSRISDGQSLVTKTLGLRKRETEIKEVRPPPSEQQTQETSVVKASLLDQNL